MRIVGLVLRNVVIMDAKNHVNGCVVIYHVHYIQVIEMEALTTLKGIGTDIIAYCPVCQKWITEVDMCYDCHPYHRDYAYCPECNTGIIRSN